MIRGKIGLKKQRDIYFITKIYGELTKPNTAIRHIATAQVL
jgi:hypothetical protein